jgi:extracellular matrix regulatory protein A
LKNELLKVGFSNYVCMDKITVIVNPDSAPVRRIVRIAKKEGKVIDVTQGRKTKSILVLQNGQMVLSAVNTDKLAERMEISPAEKTITMDEL